MGVAVPLSEPLGSVPVVSVGSITFVRFGRGEAGSEGGSWATAAGVEAVPVVVLSMAEVDASVDQGLPFRSRVSWEEVSRVATRPEKAVISAYRKEYSLAYNCKAHFLRLYHNLRKTTT